MQLDEIREKLYNGGVAGCGGAGFPSYAKLSDGVETIILNCAECEPIISLHRQLLKVKVDEILSAFSLIKKAVGATRAIVAVKSSYRTTLDVLKRVKDTYGVEIKELQSVYPTGDEIVLIYEATGKIVPAGALPITQKVIVYNVETMFNAFNALNDVPVTHKYVTVTGEVNSPVTVKAPIGASFSDLIKVAGGAKIENYALVSGGPMMGKIVSSEDTVEKTTNAILVLPTDHPVVKAREIKPHTDARRAASSCCLCNRCTDLCPRHALGYPIDPARFMRSVSHRNHRDTEAYLNARYCSSCGLCESFSCVQNLSPRRLLEVAKREINKSGIRVVYDKPTTVGSLRGKTVPVSRLIKKLKLSEYSTQANITDDEIKVSKLRVSLRQAIGAPSVACVKVGDEVKAGQIIALGGEKLGLPIHCARNGKVIAVSKDVVIEVTK